MQMIYGIHPVLETLRRSDGTVERIFIARGKTTPEMEQILAIAARRAIPVERCRRSYLDTVTGSTSHQGIACRGKEFQYAPFEDMVAAAADGHGLVLILDGVTDPHNLGSLIRTAHCFGVRGIVIPEDRAAPVTPAVVKASAGASQYMPVARVVNLARAIDAMKERNFWIYGADARGDTDIHAHDYKGNVGLVLGSEGKGIRHLVRKKCDFLISIPMSGAFDSLNVAVAGGIIIHEIARRRSVSS